MRLLELILLAHAATTGTRDVRRAQQFLHEPRLERLEFSKTAPFHGPRANEERAGRWTVAAVVEVSEDVAVVTLVLRQVEDDPGSGRETTVPAWSITWTVTLPHSPGQTI